MRRAGSGDRAKGAEGYGNWIDCEEGRLREERKLVEVLLSWEFIMEVLKTC